MLCPPDEHRIERMKRILQLSYAFRLVWKGGPGWCLASMAVVVVQGALPLAALVLLKRIVDSVIAVLPGGVGGADLRQAFWAIGLAAGVGLLEAGCRVLAGLISENQSQSVADHVQELIQRQSASMDLAFYETPAFQDTLHRAQTDARTKPLRIVNDLTRISVNGVSLAGVAVLLLAYHPGITLVLCAGMLPGFFFALRVSRKLFEWRNACTETERKTFYLHWVLTSGLFAMENKSFGFARALIPRFRRLRARLRGERLELLKQQMVGEFVAQCGGVVVVFGCLAFMAAQAAHGLMTVGSLVMFAQAMRRAEGFVRDSLLSVAHLYEDSLFLANVREFLEMKSAVAAPPAPVPVPEGSAGFRLERVTFRYPGVEGAALRDVSMELRAGQRIALVGHNGSGKSTLVKLLCRFYDLEEGSIEYGGVNIRSFDPAAYRRLIGVSFQNFNRYYLSARENVWLGNVDLDPRDPRIEESARLSGAHKILSALPQGYETQLGRWFKSGAELSQGEWQTIALARAFLSDARLLVLDEPSSFLDPDAEEQLFAHLRDLSPRKTILFVSHRFSTVRQADWIYVMEGGRVKEQGTHDDLLRQGGLYAHSFRLQARGYRTEEQPTADFPNGFRSDS